jgi:hypothetical protein
LRHPHSPSRAPCSAAALCPRSSGPPTEPSGERWRPDPIPMTTAASAVSSSCGGSIPGPHADGFDNHIRPLAQAVVSLVDDDHSGALESAELFRLLRACELPDDQARRVFDTLDVDDDGSVSSAEIIAAVHDFCLDPAPDKPGHWLFGQF